MSSKRMRIIILGVILVVTLACVEHNLGPDPTRTPNLTVEPTKAPPKTPYYRTSMGSYTTSRTTDFFTSETHTYTCTGQDAVIKMVIYLESGRVLMWAFIPNISIWGDCSVIDSGVIATDFAGTFQNDGTHTYVQWDWCTGEGRTSSTAVMDALLNPLNINVTLYPYDEVFIGGATCSWGDNTEGGFDDFSFTLYYQHEFSEADTGPR